ncbi:MAG TPA: alkaline phosphatase [Kofleriaceae bacterium]|nr:alkaline phosphatase [Kofleriaceae bacterium]
MLRRGLVALLFVAAGCGDNLASRPQDGGPTPGDAGVDAEVDAGPNPNASPVVIIMIGDGMGMGQMEASSLYRYGQPGKLKMEQLPYRGVVRTGGPSGITDSAAAATVMATGHYTYNGELGLDRHGLQVQTLVERAASRGWATGVVTTTSLPHATPAGFTSHVTSRNSMNDIATQMVNLTHPDVMLGGGTLYFAPRGAGSLRTDDGLYGALLSAGYRLAFTHAEMDAAVAAGAPRLFGAFAPDMMTYVSGRRPDTTEPMLADMAQAALTTLDRDPHGFFLMIEGGRIDHGGHAENLVDSVQETLAFDDTVDVVERWARARGNVTLLVTADHECGGLQVTEAKPAGTYPAVSWRWGAHTNARVPVFGEGPGTDIVDGEVIDHRWIYGIAKARIDRGSFQTPPREPIPDGELGDLRWRTALQQNTTGFGVGFNQLDALWLDATIDGLYIGVEGLFEWDHNAVEVWLDVDPESGLGLPGLEGFLTDSTGVADQVLGQSHVTEGASEFEADAVLVSVGGTDPHIEDFNDAAGLRGLRPPYGRANNLGWLRAAINFGDVRTRDVPHDPVPGQGMEAFVPWSMLYPGGAVPLGARIRLAAMMVDTTGGYTSNQFLPSLPPGSDNPGTASTPLPGIVEYWLDSNLDGIVDGDQPPVVLP